ncbi:hypothetical protein AAFN85_04510 [Mucilaginibacter sp. CAU 1740]|uniref:hypothetical protein n=1 Tax=Mucilaginibacter sp. CAU 1740 TaxID=3140365 RepID=UPI00325B7476
MIKKIFLTTILLVVTVLSSFAQSSDPGFPCDGTDGDAVCPLDTWVVLLALVAFAITVIHLYRKQKSIQA